MLAHGIIGLIQDFLSTVVDYSWMRSCVIAISFLCILACIALHLRNGTKRSLAIVACVTGIMLSIPDGYDNFVRGVERLPASYVVRYIIAFMFVPPTNGLLLFLALYVGFIGLTKRTSVVALIAMIVYYCGLLFVYDANQLSRW